MGFDVHGALSAGYTPDEVEAYLVQRSQPWAQPAPPPAAPSFGPPAAAPLRPAPAPAPAMPPEPSGMMSNVQLYDLPQSRPAQSLYDLINPSGMTADPFGTAVSLAANPQATYPSPSEQEFNRVYPILKKKVYNFMDAIAGPAPDGNTQWEAYKLLQNAFNVRFGEGAREYVKYKQANPIRRALTDAMVRGAIATKGDSYISDVLNKRIPLYQTDIYVDQGLYGDSENPEGKARAAYQRNVLSRVADLLRDKSTRDMLMKYITDFRTLEQPIPFVQSRINYQIPEPPMDITPAMIESLRERGQPMWGTTLPAISKRPTQK